MLSAPNRNEGAYGKFDRMFPEAAELRFIHVRALSMAPRIGIRRFSAVCRFSSLQSGGISLGV